MAVRVAAPALTAAAVVLLMIGPVRGAGPATSAVPENTIEFQDGAGNTVVALSPGETASFYIRGANLETVPTGTGIWTEISATVPENTWWGLATGAPDPDVFALVPGSLYDREEPTLTPLHSKPTAYANDVEQGVGDFRPDTGEVQIVFEVNAGGTVRIDFDFDVADSYAPEQYRARVTSDSDAEGEWASMSEVMSETDAEASPISGLFRGEVALAANGAATAAGDGAVWVQPGDVLTGTYYESDGVTLVDTHRVEVSSAPTPLPAARPVALIAAAAALALVFWFAARPSPAESGRAG